MSSLKGTLQAKKKIFCPLQGRVMAARMNLEEEFFFFLCKGTWEPSDLCKDKQVKLLEEEFEVTERRDWKREDETRGKWILELSWIYESKVDECMNLSNNEENVIEQEDCQIAFWMF